jgi:impB/mucB/samB family
MDELTTDFASDLRVLMLDFNAYFASVEQQLNPALRGVPLGIVPMKAETTSCIAASNPQKTRRLGAAACSAATASAVPLATRGVERDWAQYGAAFAQLRR